MTAKPKSRYQDHQATMKVARPTYARLTEIKEQMQAPEVKDRQVTYSEVLDELVRHWRATGQLDVKEAGR
jgi:hypothetical protein